MFDINDPSVYDDNYTILSKIRKIWRALKDLISRVTSLENKPEYSLPTATSDRLGGIKVGENLTVEEDGTLNAQAGGGGGYTLPPATTTTLGGIIVGDNLTIDENGKLDADNSGYTLPIASDQTLGGIKVGNNLSIEADGTLNATGGGSSVNPSSSNPLIDGTASAGSSIDYARGDHVHPSQLVEVTQAQYDALVLAGTVDPNVDYHITDAGSEGYIQNINASASVDSGTGTPSVTVTKTGTNANPNFAFAFSNLKGADGQDGTDGTDGTDGISPTITVRSITGGNQIEIVSAGGTERFDVMDGTDGEDGAGLVDYSTSEQDTGLKWIDGKAIYQRTFTFNMPTVVTEGAQVDLQVGTITGLETLIKLEGSFMSPANYVMMSFNVANPTTTAPVGGAILFFNGGQNREINAITVRSNMTAYNGRVGHATIRYTKSS